MTETLVLTLNGPLVGRIRAAAQARGLSPEKFVRQLLAADIAAQQAARGETSATSVIPDSAER